MILFKKASDLRKWLDVQVEKGRTIGFVPTMGALHEGHISLIGYSRKQNPVTVCSIFVNPTQFNDPADFEKYPVTIEKDIRLLEETGCDVLFLPSVKEIYPGGTGQASPGGQTNTRYELGYLETVLEGKFRPGHFQGVCMVVQRLLEIVQPSHLYLGQKDYQQCMVITKLVELMGQQGKINVAICPTLREADGLAMSSRNMRLSKEERETAVAISRSLRGIKENIRPGSLDAIKDQAIVALEKEGFKIDYVAIADANDLSLVDQWDGKQKLVALVAAFLNNIRLIDNMLLN
jgi:pantoate--beta-alanine ligase